VPLQVDDDVPYLTRDCSGLCDAYTIKRLTALGFTNEKDGRFCVACQARAADHSSSRSSADPGTGKLDNDCDSDRVPTAASEDEEDSNNDDENVDAAVTDGEENVRRSPKDEAQSVRHKTTHKPALPEHCDACKIGKTRNARKYKRNLFEIHSTSVTWQHVTEYGCEIGMVILVWVVTRIRSIFWISERAGNTPSRQRATTLMKSICV
jgi:hypothetical protein